MTDSFVFYDSFADAIDLLPDAEQLEAYRAIVRYALRGEEPQISSAAMVVFVMAKPQIDANQKRRTDGRKGGAPKGNQNASKQQKQPVVVSENNQWLNKKQPNVNVNVNGNVNANGNGNVNESDGAKAPRTRHKYGQYENVLLSDEELEKLKKEFPFDWEERIERVSSYVAATGKKYKNFLATIRNWANRDKEKQKEEDGKWAVTPPEEQMPYPWEVE